MHTTAVIIQITLALLFPAGVLFRWDVKPRVQRVLRTLAGKQWARKAYVLATAILILAWNFACFVRDGASAWLLPGLAVGFAMLTYKSTGAILQWMQKRWMLLYWLYAASAFTLPVPQLLSFSIVLILLPAASLLYPSKTAVEEMEDWLAGRRNQIGAYAFSKYYFRDR